MRWVYIWGGYMVLWVFVACQKEVLTPTPALSPPTLIPLPPTTTALPTELSARPGLIICAPELPTSLYPHLSGRWTDQLLWGILYDGPLNTTHPTYPPTLLTEWPTIANNGIGQELVEVTTSEAVWNPAEGQPKPYSGPPVELPQVVVTFTLKSDLFWSDGKAITAADFLTAFQELDPQDERRQATASYKPLTSHQIRWVGLPSYHTVDYAQFLIPPLPTHRWSASDSLTIPITQTLPLSWGPYMPMEWTKATDSDLLTLLLQPNPAYWGDQPANFAQIRWLIVPDSYTAAVFFIARECNLAFLDDPTYGHIFTFDPYGYLEIPTSSIQALHLVSDLDPAVAKAFTYAIDGPLLADLVHGTALPNAFDPGRARELLDEAGWVEIDGQRQKEQQLLQLQLAYNSTNRFEQQVAQILQIQLAEVGLTIILTPTAELPPAGVDLFLHPVSLSGKTDNLVPLYILNQFALAYHTHKPYLMDPAGFPSWSIETWPPP